MSFQKKLFAYLQLMRPANIVTAIADIMAGAAATGVFTLALYTNNNDWNSDYLTHLLWLIGATIGLYGGGVVFNDVLDAELDQKERPERAIPRGDVSVTEAGMLGGVLLAGGILMALQVSWISAIIALAVALCALLYDAWGKHQLIFGPLNMGLCRGGNLLLGMSLIPATLSTYWYISIIPVVYIAAITMISRGEVHGGNRLALWGGAGLYALVVVSIVLLISFSSEVNWVAFLFLGLFASQIFPPLMKAIHYLKPQFIGKAVKAGVISLIILDATLAAVFTSWEYGLLVLLLLPISFGLARFFAVT
ncbi:MAG: UbiA-like protein EboC [Cyclobacteriaceae bacterium]